MAAASAGRVCWAALELAGLYVDQEQGVRRRCVQRTCCKACGYWEDEMVGMGSGVGMNVQSVRQIKCMCKSFHSAEVSVVSHCSGVGQSEEGHGTC